ncbi:MAG: Uma2 family endonuclease [Isosphaeraceae bacterium]
MSTAGTMPPGQAQSVSLIPPMSGTAGQAAVEPLFEVVDGKIEEKKIGAREIEIATILTGHLFQCVREHRSGRVLVEFVFRIIVEKDLQRRPDVAFVSHARWPFHRRVPDLPVWDMAPDLAIEVISQSNSAFQVQDKIHDYFEAGVRQVWVIYPKQAEVYVYSSPKQVQILGIGQDIEGGDLLPGFRLPVAHLFEDDPE